MRNTFEGRETIGDEIVEVVVVSDPRDGNHIVGSGYAVDLGYAIDREQIVGNRFQARALDVHENKGGNHTNAIRVSLGHPRRAEPPLGTFGK